jgi:hypothetical protein
VIADGGTYRFPFGRAVKPVVPVARGHRRVFVLGVYPSAVHAAWTEPDGSRWPALAIDNEPEPFWTGVGAEELVGAVAREVPKEVGHLEPAAHEHNGASGIALDELYLRRLGPDGMDRRDCWITDIVQSYLANEGQLARIAASYEKWVEAGLVPPANLARRHGLLSTLPPGREESLRSELEEASPDLVVTLGAEPLRCLGLGGLDRTTYGSVSDASILGLRVRLLPLVHPRQAGRLGKSSPEWEAVHREWLETKASNLRL